MRVQNIKRETDVTFWVSDEVKVAIIVLSRLEIVELAWRWSAH